MRLKLSLAAAACAATFVTAVMAPAPATAQQQRFVTIGTGGVTGVYYPAGGAICRLVNRDRAKHGIRCSVESTGASVANVNLIKQSELDFGVAQADVQFNATKGAGAFAKDGAVGDLRFVFSLHPELMTVVARREANIKSMADFKGKRFNIGNPGSGTRTATEELMASMGLKATDLALASELRADEQGPALCDGKIDGFTFVVGHPSANITDPTTICGAQIVPVTGPAVDKLLADKPFYTKAQVPGGMYKGNAGAVDSYGVLATVVSGAKVPDDVVYTVVKAVFDNINEFKALHPALANLKPEEMATKGQFAPVHPGAARYYKEKGWMK
jgi:uncharacterized protein